MALCFASLGEAKAATELLLQVLHVNDQKEASMVSCSEDMEQEDLLTAHSATASFYQPTTIFLDEASDDFTIERSLFYGSCFQQTNATGTKDDHYRCPYRTNLLWRLFHAASHAGDISAYEAASTEILSEYHQHEQHLIRTDQHSPVQARRHCWAITSMRLFSLLQNGRHMQATIREAQRIPLTQEKSNDEGIMLDEGETTIGASKIMSLLYEADATICTNSAIRSHHLSNRPSQEGQIKDSISTAIDTEWLTTVDRLTANALDEFTAQLSPIVASINKKILNFGNRDNSFFQIEIAAKNNRAIALVLHNRRAAAMKFLYDAAMVASRSKASQSKQNVSGECLVPFFNLSLVLLSDRHVRDAARVWFNARGRGDLLHEMIDGRGKIFRMELDRAISVHAFLSAKPVGPLNGWRWSSCTTSDNRIGLIPAVKVATLEVTLLWSLLL